MLNLQPSFCSLENGFSRYASWLLGFSSLFVANTREIYRDFSEYWSISSQGDLCLAIDERANEEYRKIQFSGKSSYVLALPKRWVEEMKLRAGDQVAVLRQGDTSLVITPRVNKPYGSKSEAVVEIAPGAKPTSSARRLISVYLLGYSVIQVKGKDGALTSNQ